MKWVHIVVLTSGCLLPGITGAQMVQQSVPPPSAPQYVVVARGPNQKVWQSISWVTNAVTGLGRPVKHSYIELQTGAGLLSNGQWTDATPAIQITSTGAQATNVQHPVVFSGNINSSGAISMGTPDGLRLKSNVLGISYWDASSGNSVFIGEIRDTTGQVLPTGNQAIYPDAFDGGFRVDLLYVNSLADFEQLVIFREQPPSPSTFGIDPTNAYLQVITEFIDPPTPQIVASSASADADEYLNFGIMQMGPGEAFALGSETNRIPVTKHWVVLDGRTCLIEQIKFRDAEAELQNLPMPSPRTASLRTRPGSLIGRVTPHPVLPRRPKVRQTTPALALAKSASLGTGFAADYTIVTTQTNRVFQSDTTYFVTGNITLMGSNVFEGGTVIKFATNTSLAITPSYTTPTVSFLGSAYRPIVLTAKDDDSVGDYISGSTSSPTGYYASVALNIAGINPQIPALNYTRIAFARQAVSLGAVSVNVSDSQFVNCQEAMGPGGATVTLRNVLFANNVTNLAPVSSHVSAENVTFSGSAYLATGATDSSLALYMAS